MRRLVVETQRIVFNSCIGSSNKLSMPSNQIKGKRLFSFVRIGCHQYHLGAKNLDFLVFFIKNWPNNTCVNVENDEGLGDEDKFGVQAKKGVLDVLDMEFPNGVEDHVKKMCRI